MAGQEEARTLKKRIAIIGVGCVSKPISFAFQPTSQAMLTPVLAAFPSGAPVGLSVEGLAILERRPSQSTFEGCSKTRPSSILTTSHLSA
jgi:hypothetical protein